MSFPLGRKPYRAWAARKRAAADRYEAEAERFRREAEQYEALAEADPPIETNLDELAS